MTVLGANGHAGLRADGTITPVTTAGRFNSSNVSHTHYHTLGAFFVAENFPFTNPTNFWMGGQHYKTNDNRAEVWLKVEDAASTEFVRVIGVNNTYTVQAQYWNGSSWVNAGSAASLLPWDSSVYFVALNVVCNSASGSIKLYVGDTLLIDETVDLSAFTEVAACYWGTLRGSTSSLGSMWSEFLWGDESVLGHSYHEVVPNANGFHTAASSGSYTSVDETIVDDADYFQLDANTDKQSMTHGTLTLPADGSVKTVMVNSRVANVTGGADNIRAFLRISSTDYPQASNFAGMGLNAAGYAAAWETNPSTAGAWTIAAAEAVAMEFGLEAIT